jgi:hypothetical protein
MKLTHRDLANSDSSLPENGCGQLRPEIEEEHKNDRNDPAVDHARNKAVDKTACAEQIEVGKDGLQKRVPLEVREGQPKDYAQDIDCLEQHARGEHDPKIRELGHVHSPPSPLLKFSPRNKRSTLSKINLLPNLQGAAPCGEVLAEAGEGVDAVSSPGGPWRGRIGSNEMRTEVG